MFNKSNITGLAIAMTLTMNVSAGETVDTYLTSSNGQPVVSKNGECVLSKGGITAKQLNACGHEPRAQVKVATTHIEIVANQMSHSITATKNNVVVLNAGLLFDFDSAELKESSKYVLDERMDRFKGNLNFISDINVVGHTDSMGSAEYNMQLSEKRAKAVAEYLKENAYKSDYSLAVSGMGESEPVASNETINGRQQNRRVEIHFNAIDS